MDQTSTDLSSEAADANAAAGFELFAETFYSEIKQESTAATLLLRRHENRFANAAAGCLDQLDG